MAKEKNDKAEAAAKVELSPEEAAAKAKKKKLLLIIIGGAVATIGIGGGAAFFLMKGSDKPAAPAGEHAEEAGAEHADPKKEEGKKEDPSAPKKEEAKKDEKGDAKKDEKSASADKKDDKDVPPKLPANVDIGCTHQFKSFNLNLGNPLENRYIRLELALEHGCAEEDKNEVKLREPQLRDAIINVISKKTREFLLSPDGKAQLTYEIRNQINQRMSRPVKDVYITDILIE
jgi:flagellar FliL protein